MVGKSPFLFDVQRDLTESPKDFSLRDAGEFRGLAPLFPNASLKWLSRLVALVASNKLPAGQYRLPASKGTKGGGKSVSIATRILSETFPDANKQISTWQLFLDLACDMRLLRRMPQQYVVHSYGRPLAYLFDELGDGAIESSNWRTFFLDRLLYEDGVWIQTVLSLLAETNSLDQSAYSLGKDMRKQVFDRIGEKLYSGKTPRWAANLLQDRIGKTPIRPAARRLTEQRRRKTDDVAKRRIELEFVTRRDWLIELGLAHVEDSMVRLTTSGQQLADYIGAPFDLGLDFFTGKIARVLTSIVPDVQWKQPVDALEILESTFMRLTKEPIRIVETAVLINTVIFASLPVVYGERQDVLNILDQASRAGQTALVLQSGQRIRNFYVKQRKGRPSIKD